MTGDVKEAFHLATVAYVDWHGVNEKQRWIGWRNVETGQREYLAEPTVEFFGRTFTLSEICSRAAILTGRLPPHVRALFGVIDDGAGEPVPETYPEAVDALEAAIACEHDFQAEAPVSRPAILDQIRLRSFKDGFATALGMQARRAGVP